MMDDKEIEELVQSINEGKDITNNSIFRIMVALNKRVKQLYQQTYNPPTNNDLNKSINDLSSRISILESKIKYYVKKPEKCKIIIKNANQYVSQFKNKSREDLISLLVIEKYFHFTGQQEKTSFLDY